MYTLPILRPWKYSGNTQVCSVTATANTARKMKFIYFHINFHRALHSSALTEMSSVYTKYVQIFIHV